MGSNCKIMLPPDVRLRDVATAIGALAGLPSQLANRGSYVAAEVEGVRTEPNSAIAECANIHLAGKMSDKTEVHFLLYHFECDGGGRCLLPRSTPFWCGIAKGLVDFFGGTVDYDDCDASDVDYSAPKPRENNAPEDGEDWQKFQRELAALTAAKPLRDVASYRVGE